MEPTGSYNVTSQGPVINIRCTAIKKVHVPGRECHVFEFFVLGAHDGGNAAFPNGHIDVTVMGDAATFTLGDEYQISFSRTARIPT